MPPPFALASGPGTGSFLSSMPHFVGSTCRIGGATPFSVIGPVCVWFWPCAAVVFDDIGIDAGAG